jgi:hypothetical protein
MELDFEIDKLTHSLEDRLTGEVFPTNVVLATKPDLKTVTKKNGWNFDWKVEFSNANKQVFKLVLRQKPDIIQGLVAFTIYSDHVFMDLIETAPHNLGENKRYEGVMGNLVAYGCKTAFMKGFNGEMAFVSKTKLMPHYQQKLGAEVLWGQRMGIKTKASILLVNRYFPDFFIE